MGIQIKSIEDAFVQALTPLVDQGLRTLDSYAEHLGVDDLRKMVSRVPAIYVVWSGSSIETINQVDQYASRVLVFVCDVNLRGQSAARRGDAVSPGAYAWMDKCRALLHRKHILQGWSPARCQSENILAADSSAVVLQAIYEIMTRVST